MVEMSKQLGFLITFFVLFIIGVNLLIPVADQVAGTSQLRSVVNESITPTNGSTNTLANPDVSGTLTLTNSSGETFTSGTSGNFSLVALTGVITWTFSEVNMNETDYNASYTFFPDAFVKDGTSRTILSIITLFFALAVLLMLISLFMIMSGNSFRDLF